MPEVAMEFALDRRGVGLRLMTPVSVSLPDVREVDISFGLRWILRDRRSLWR